MTEKGFTQSEFVVSRVATVTQTREALLGRLKYATCIGPNWTPNCGHESPSKWMDQLIICDARKARRELHTEAGLYVLEYPKTAGQVSRFIERIFSTCDEAEVLAEALRLVIAHYTKVHESQKAA